MDIRIEQPFWLLLLIPLAVYFIYAWRTTSNISRLPKSILFTLRCVAISLLVFALTVPYVNLHDQEQQVLFVVDRSASANSASEDIDKWLKESLKARSAHQSVGFYSFAKSFQTDVQLTSDEVKLPVVEPLSEDGETDIAKAIDLAASIGKPTTATRIVLLSDGLETTQSIEALLPKYTTERVQIDTMLLKPRSLEDAAITKFETPQTAYEGENQLLQVEIESTTSREGTLLILQNDEEIIRAPVTLERGKNAFAFHSAAAGQGLIKYEAALLVDDDSFLQNNKMLSITSLEQAPQVLIVETERSPSVIPDLLDKQSLHVARMQAEQLPETLSSYLAYDAIIFDNVPGHLVGEQKMGVIEQAVKNFGVGFMMVGGDESFGLGGYFKSPIERLLPVEMEVKGKEQLPSLGLVIILDRSGSMSGSKMVLAREAAARSVELLRDDDTFGFTAFDDQIWEVIPVGPLRSKQEAIDQILSVPVGGGTNIFPSVEKAYEDLGKTNLQRKHIILLTDGQSDMPPNYEEVLANGRNEQITLSTVGIGADADQNLLESLAEEGGGRFYDVYDETTIPSILARETSMMTRTYIEDDPFHMTLRSIPQWSSLFHEGVPEMNAYIATMLKSTATIVGESPKEDPVLAEWMYGLGRTVAFTSDSTGKWSGDLARWEGYSDFWNTAVSRLLPSYSNVPYIVSHERGNVFTVTDSSKEAAFMELAVVNEQGEELPFISEPLAPGKTRVTIEGDAGLVFLRVADDKNGLFETGMSLPYGEEYKPEQPNKQLLEKIAAETGGKLIENPKDAFRDHPFSSTERKPIMLYLVLAAMVLIFLDITIRRFSLFRRTTIRVERVELQEQKKSEAERNMDELLKATKRK